MKRLSIIAVILLLSPAAWADGGHVIASIKPLHSLVAAIMEGTGDAPVLLVTGAASPHDYALKPSQVRALSQSDIVFYMGDSFETFLPKTLSALPSSIPRVAMQTAPGITLYPLRTAEGFEPDADDITGAPDLHLWLSPANARLMATEITRKLSALYPKNKALYAANEKKLDARLIALDARLKAELAPVRHKPFIVFHDAYQYFQKAYGLDISGSITINPDQPPGAKHVRNIRRKIETPGAVCVFREPSFDSRVVASLISGTSARSGLLDPEGALLSPGPDLYFQLMEKLAGSLNACLSS